MNARIPGRVLANQPSFFTIGVKSLPLSEQIKYWWTGLASRQNRPHLMLHQQKVLLKHYLLGSHASSRIVSPERQNLLPQIVGRTTALEKLKKLGSLWMCSKSCSSRLLSMPTCKNGIIFDGAEGCPYGKTVCAKRGFLAILVLRTISSFCS